MNFTAKHHLKVDNYIKYIDEILHKCDKGIEYCKICPNEFVCTELEKDDFGLEGSTMSDMLAAIQYALSKIPGYLNSDKRNELRVHIKSYINGSPLHEQGIWEDSILDILLGEKLANSSYKPKAKIGEARTLLTCDSAVSFSACLKCFCLENEDVLPNTKATLHHEISSNSTKIVNKFIQDKHINITIPHKIDQVKYCLPKSMTEIIQRCNLTDIGLAAALTYYAVLTGSLIPENIAVAGGLDSQGMTLQVDSLDGKLETVFRELHFIDKIVIPQNSLRGISTPTAIEIIEVASLGQAVDVLFKN